MLLKANIRCHALVRLLNTIISMVSCDLREVVKTSKQPYEREPLFESILFKGRSC